MPNNAVLATILSLTANDLARNTPTLGDRRNWRERQTPEARRRALAEAAERRARKNARRAAR